MSQPEADGFYAALIEAHRGLSETESHALNARLVLLLAGAVGDAERVRALLDTARKAGAEGDDPVSGARPDES